MQTKQEKPKRFVIDRSRWRFGGEEFIEFGNTELLNSFGYQCCLGFVSEQLGVPRQELHDCVNPARVRFQPGQMETGEHCLKDVLVNVVEMTVSDKQTKYVTQATILTQDCISINDDPRLEQDRREQRLIEEFAKYGYALVFKGGYNKRQQKAIERNRKVHGNSTVG